MQPIPTSLEAPYDPAVLRNLEYRGTTAERRDRMMGGPEMRRGIEAMLARAPSPDEGLRLIEDFRKHYTKVALFNQTHVVAVAAPPARPGEAENLEEK